MLFKDFLHQIQAATGEFFEESKLRPDQPIEFSKYETESHARNS